MKLTPRPLTRQDAAALTELWNLACGEQLRVSPRMFEYMMRTRQGIVQDGRLVVDEGRAAGFVQTSIVPASPEIASREVGWIDALTVHPEFRRLGLGNTLLNWAETWLREKGAATAALGGGLRPLVPGLPEELRNHMFFRKRGYQGEAETETAWDLARDLGGDPNGAWDTKLPGVYCHPAQAEQQHELTQFLRREFPGRWSFEFRDFVREEGRPSDYMLLWHENSLQGFARMTFADSERPLDRFFMHRLAQPWAQIGPIGISAGCRGRGYGCALVEAVLCHLRRRGVRGCIIDWTTVPDYYRRFGFRPYRQYLLLRKKFT
jgi:predicted N-acetyltransferase YhbS